MLPNAAGMIILPKPDIVFICKKYAPIYMLIFGS